MSCIATAWCAVPTGRARPLGCLKMRRQARIPKPGEFLMTAESVRAGVLLLCLLATFDQAIARSDRQQNLATCLSGKYPALCDHSKLTPEQLREAVAAEKRENLKICMTGKYPALCDHDKLSSEEAARVRAAERAENLKVCLIGKYPALCNHDILTPEQLQSVRTAEASENLKICLDGRFPTLCKHAMLTQDERTRVATAEKKAAPARRQLEQRIAERRATGDCESHSIEEIEGDGKIIKLDDGSLWEVDDVDTVTTSIWLPVSEVVVCQGKMVNVDDDESVQVTPILLEGSAPAGSASRPSYIVEAAAEDETFVINGEIFKAKTYCSNLEKGDKVIFVSGSAFGACTSARILNLRTQRVCDVWCE